MQLPGEEMTVHDITANIRAERVSADMDRYITAQRMKTLAAKWPVMISKLYSRFDDLVNRFNAELLDGDIRKVKYETIIHGWRRARAGEGKRQMVTLRHDVDARTLTAFYEEFGTADTFQEPMVCHVFLSKDEQLQIHDEDNPDSWIIPYDKFISKVLEPLFRGIRPSWSPKG